LSRASKIFATRVRITRRMNDFVIALRRLDAGVGAVAVAEQHTFEIVVDQKLIGAIAMSADGEVKDVERNHELPR
jgi:hypothetical protein